MNEQLADARYTAGIPVIVQPLGEAFRSVMRDILIRGTGLVHSESNDARYLAVHLTNSNGEQAQRLTNNSDFPWHWSSN